MVSPSDARGALILLHRFEKLPSLSSAAAPRGRSTGASGGSLLLYPETDGQRVWLVGPDPRVRDWVVASDRDGEAHYRRRRFACHVAVCLLITWRPAHQLYDLWPRAPVSEAGSLWCAPGKMGASGRVFLEKGFSLRAAVTLSHSLFLLHPFSLELYAPLCIRALLLHTCATADAMTSLGNPTASRPRRRSMWCATCLDGVRRRSPGGSALAPSPLVTSPPGSSFCSPPTSPAG
jgi:hypothetical protein